MEHTCHLPGCQAACPPRHPFCREHWAMVPKDLQQDVYDTVGIRGKRVDATWAPWWRAQSAATVHVLRIMNPDHEEQMDKLERSEEAFIGKLLLMGDS